MSPAPNRSAANLEAVIVGAGFSGLCMAIKLKQAGIDEFVILERAQDVGGVWRDNHYPGCSCDVPSHLYSFSFEPDPDWSEMYASQSDILGYLRRCADKYGIRPHIRFATEVVDAAYDEAGEHWRVRISGGETVVARLMVLAVGTTSQPSIPAVAGRDVFEGATFHSAAWDHGFDPSGKSVAVIGTGASAIQFVPRIAPKLKQLYLFQRSPPWTIRKHDRAISGRERGWFRRLPFYRRAFRMWLYLLHELLALGLVYAPRLLRPLESQGRRRIERHVHDPALRKAVTPDYTIGCKRILLSNDYLPTLNRPNVEVVTAPVETLHAHSIVTRDGVERPIDAIIYATGFRATDFLAHMKILGRNKVDINDAWRNGAEAYLGMTVTGFPNLFLLTGPNTAVLNSLVFMIECQVNHVMGCIRMMHRRGLRRIEVRSDIQSRFARTLLKRMERTVWKSGCTSYYLDRSGRNSVVWPGFSLEYWLRTRRVRPSDYST